MSLKKSNNNTKNEYKVKNTYNMNQEIYNLKKNLQECHEELENLKLLEDYYSNKEPEYRDELEKQINRLLYLEYLLG